MWIYWYTVLEPGTYTGDKRKSASSVKQSWCLEHILNVRTTAYMRKAVVHTSTMPEASIYASNEPKSYSWYDLGDCRDSHNKHALRVYYGWIFLRLFIYVMVVSATVRYGTSVSHISLPQTSVSVDSWVVKEKSKNYHNWTSSASYDVCAPVFLSRIER